MKLFIRGRSDDGVDQTLERLRRSSRGQIACWERLPAEAASFAEPSTPLSSTLTAAIANAGIARLYEHQARAHDEILAGNNAVIVTPTASGKTLAFALPILERLLSDPEARALLVYPTNALVQDQARTLQHLVERIEGAPRVAVLTGATDTATRRAYRESPPRLLLTNPEMLHLSLLGAHRAWWRFLGGLRFVVLDELHLYRGLFGSHMAMVLRRLRRVAARYRREPQFIACSATVGNPGDMAERITGLPFTVIQGRGAARGPRTVVTWRAGLSGEIEGSDAQSEAVRLFTRFVGDGLGTILFALTRTGAEAMHLQARDLLGPALGGRIAPYRNGYAAEQRREIEGRLKSGDLLGVVSTNALEVGIDIGILDAAVIAGFPGSRSSFWQQAGRAGRGTRPAAVIFVPYPRVVDGYYAAHPETLLRGGFEEHVIDLANEDVAAVHLACAADERVLAAAEARHLSPVAARALALASAAGTLGRTAEGWAPTSDNSHGAVSLRGGGPEVWGVRGPRGRLGTIDRGHLYREAHPGAVYLHAGERLRVVELDPIAREVRMRDEPAALTTQPVVQTTVHVAHRQAEKELAAGRHRLRISTGRLDVRETTIAFRERSRRGGREARLVALDPPLAAELHTTGAWAAFPPEVRRQLEASDPLRFVSGLHALEHLLPAAVSLFLLCDPRDVIAVFAEHHIDAGGAALFLYDDYPGGAGIALRAGDSFGSVLDRAAAIVEDCPCVDGCPGCIVSATCWRVAEEAGKDAALALFAALGYGRG